MTDSDNPLADSGKQQTSEDSSARDFGALSLSEKDSDGFYGGTTGTFERSAASMKPGDDSAEKIGQESGEPDGAEISPAHHGVGLAITVAALGVLIGVVGGSLSRFYDWVQKLFLGARETVMRPDFLPVPGWRRFAAVVIGGCIGALVWYFLRSKTTRVPSVAGAVAGQKMPAWQTIVQVVTEFFMVATGASVGKEVAPREMGTMLSQQWMRIGRRIGLRSEDVHLLAAAGAGAGFASVYISPLAGAFFASEMLLRRISFETICVSLGMSSIAAFVGAAINGADPYYILHAVYVQAFSGRDYIIAVIMAPLFGFVGGWFRMLASQANSTRVKGRTILWLLPVASALTGLAAMAVPAMLSNGRLLAQLAMDTSAGSVVRIGGFAVSGIALAGILLVFAAVKIVLTLFTLKAGAGGGTLTPSISVGACLGAALGLVVAAFIPGVRIWQFALCGAVGVLAAAQKAPLMAVAMLLEISHLPISFAGPFGVVVAVSISVSRLAINARQAQKQ